MKSKREIPAFYLWHGCHKYKSIIEVVHTCQATCPPSIIEFDLVLKQLKLKKKEENLNSYEKKKRK